MNSETERIKSFLNSNNSNNLFASYYFLYCCDIKLKIDKNVQCVGLLFIRLHL